MGRGEWPVGSDHYKSIFSKEYFGRRPMETYISDFFGLDYLQWGVASGKWGLGSGEWLVGSGKKTQKFAAFADFRLQYANEIFG